MHAYNAGGEEIAADDDGVENYNAKITISASANQTYYFKVKGYNSDETGSYRIVANFRAYSEGENISSSIPLEFGSPVSGNISAGGEYWYSVSIPSSGFVTVETTGSTNTYMYAHNAATEELARDDDSGEGNNARITIYAASAQVYYFKIKGYRSSTTGSYSVAAIFSADSESRGGENMSSSTPLEFGSSVPGNILRGGEYWYSVRPVGNGNIVMETTGPTDTYMHLYNADGEELIKNDNDGEGRNARITIYAYANQTYYFKVRASISTGTGPYRVTANFNLDSEGGRGVDRASSIPLQFASAVNGNIFNGREYWYSVSPRRYGFVTVETTGDTDTYMYAYDADEEYLDSNNNGGEGRNAKITVYTFPNRTYYFKVRGNTAAISGPYRITASFSADPENGRGAERTSPIPVRIGSPVPGNVSRNYWYSITIPGNGYVLIETPGTETYMHVLSSNGQLIDKNYGGFLDEDVYYYERLIIHTLTAQTFSLMISGDRMRGNDGYRRTPYNVLVTFHPNSQNTSREQAVPLRIGSYIPVDIGQLNEHRWFYFEISAPSTLTIYTTGGLDSVLEISDTNGIIIANDNDSGNERNARISQRFAAGRYYIDLYGYSNHRGYTILHLENR
jgi:hypothetical protein